MSLKVHHFHDKLIFFTVVWLSIPPRCLFYFMRNIGVEYSLYTCCTLVGYLIIKKGNDDSTNVKQMFTVAERFRLSEISVVRKSYIYVEPVCENVWRLHNTFIIRDVGKKNITRQAKNHVNRNLWRRHNVCLDVTFIRDRLKTKTLE